MHPQSYYGLFSPSQRVRLGELLAGLGVRHEFVQVEESEERLREWGALDASSASSNVGFELFIRSDDRELLGSQLVEMFPERRFASE